MESLTTARSKEDIALDLLKFVAATAHVGSKSPGATAGFGVPTSAKLEDQVGQLLELYTRCRHAVESPITSSATPSGSTPAAKA